MDKKQEAARKVRFGRFLTDRFLEYQQQIGQSISLTKWAKHLGVGRAALSQWKAGQRLPDEESLVKLSEKLGLDVYDEAGIPRPDPVLQWIIDQWHAISEQNLQDELKNFLKRRLTTNESKRPRTADKSVAGDGMV